MKTPDTQTTLKEMAAHISQCKEMAHRAHSRIEKLAEMSFEMEDHLKQKEFAERVTELFSISNTFEEKLESFIHDYEMERNRIENEAR